MDLINRFAHNKSSFFYFEESLVGVANVKGIEIPEKIKFRIKRQCHIIIIGLTEEINEGHDFIM